VLATAPATSVNIEDAGVFPNDNDIHPLVNDPVNLGTGSSQDNPENWMWASSFAWLSAFPALDNITRNGTPFTPHNAPLNGRQPGTGAILQLTYPASYTLFEVSRKADADCVKSQDSVSKVLMCDFSGHPGPALAGGGNDLNVTGGTSGVSGAVRERIRFLCRDNTVPSIDPYTSNPYDTELTGAINSAGFTVVKFAFRTDGSRCQVRS
jgi:hypothetical protein